MMNDPKKNEKELRMETRGIGQQQGPERSSNVLLQAAFQENGDRDKVSPNLSAMPLITVITVVFNGEKHLEQAIQSVLGQSYRNVEYLVIDGGSTDNTLEIIKKYEDGIDRWISEPDNGIYDAMNKGIRLAKGELIGLLNADDYYEPDALKLVAEMYSLRKSTGIYYGHTFILQEDLRLRYKHYSTLKYWHGMSVGHQAMFVHRNVYDTLGTYNTKYRFAADYDFLLRTVQRGIRYYNVDVFLVNYRNSGMTITNLYRALNEGRIISRAHFGAFSKRHVMHALVLVKRILLNELQKLLQRVMGRRLTDKLKIMYIEKIVAQDRRST